MAQAQRLQTMRPHARQGPLGVRFNLHEGWIAGILLAVMLMSVTSSLSTANWTDGLGQTIWAALAGLLFGVLVARLRLNGALAAVLAFIVGLAAVAWLVSSHVGAPPDATWNDKMVLIEDRIDQWFVRVINGGIGTDSFVFLCVMCTLSWLVGYLSAWSVFRHHQPWGAILPAGVMLLVNLFYAPPQSGVYMVMFLLVALLLLVRTTLLKRQQAWSTYAVRFANDIGLDFLTYGVIFSALVILLAWLIPPSAPGPEWFGGAFERVRQPWQDVQDDMSRAFSTVRGTNSAAPTTFFGSSLSMGGPIRLGNRDVFQIDAPYGRYWRAVVFDKYTGTGWVSTAGEAATFLAGDERLKPMPMDKRKVISETVEVRLPTDNLVVSASQPQAVSEPTNVKFLVGRTGADEGYLDVHSLRLDRPVKLGDKYVVSSSISAADLESLRAASTDIPSYIRSHYLALPDTVPARVRELSVRVTSGATTEYDKAVAIEQYLRAHITYNDAVEPVPAGRDGVDYVLFDRPEGYCNYYASAMAVMARAVGIPARVASGYSVGETSDDGLYHINESNAHSWPELYLGETGWIEFEPTAGRPEITRPVRQEVVEQGQDEPLPTDPRNAPGFGEQRAEELDRERALAEQERARLGPLAALASPWGAALLLALAGIGAFVLVQFNWRRRLAALRPAARAAEEMYRLAPWAGLRERADATPDERAQGLAALMPDARASIAEVNSLYVRERYGAYPLSAEESTSARALGVAVQRRTWGAIYERAVGHRIQQARATLLAAVQGARQLPARLQRSRRED